MLDTGESSCLNSTSCNNSPFHPVSAVHRGTMVEELCRGSLEAVSSLYPALRNLQTISELENVKALFSRLHLHTTGPFLSIVIWLNNRKLSASYFHNSFNHS